MRRPGILLGALTGALLTAALVSVLYLARQSVGVAFLPFDAFDWLARVMPGAMVTFGIDAMVSIIRALRLGDTSTVAKVAEMTMAVLGFVVVLGGIGGGLLFLGLRARRKERALLPGLLLGAAFGLPLVLISASVNESARVSPIGSALWSFSALLLWGLLLGWSYQRLTLRTAPESGDARAERIDRRRFLVRLGGATATMTVTGAVVGRLFEWEGGRGAAMAELDAWSATHPLPNAGHDVRPVPGTRAELTPVSEHYRIDINTTPPRIVVEEWRLRVTGMVQRPLELTLDELERHPPLHQFVTLSCISNPVAGDLISTTRWTGVSLQHLVRHLGVDARASHLLIRSADGFFEVLSLADVRNDERIMLTYAWDGLPLPEKHGFPLRIYIPDRYGMKQPKWIESIEAIDSWRAGYWVERGWSREARVRATSVIDTVATNVDPQTGRARANIPIGGISYAGARGISRVQLRIDDGEWRDAKLRQPLSPTSWVLWRVEWPFEPGEHSLSVRCWDRDGVMQVVEPAPVRPDGATGLHSVDFIATRE